MLATFKIFYLDIKNRYDFVIISSGDGFLYALSAKIFLHKRRPMVIMRLHGYEGLFKKELETEKRAGRGRSYFTVKERIFMLGFRLLQVRLFSYFCDAIFSINDKEKDYLKRLYPKKRIFSLPTSLDPIFASPLEAMRDKDILFVGGWTRLKGRLYLADILNELIKGRKDLTVSIIGTGVEERHVMADLSAPLKDRVRIVRSLPRDMLKKEYSSHKVFLFPSLFEGYGNVVLEAMASGIAVVISEGLGVSELIENGCNGFLVKKRDVAGFVRIVEKVLGDDHLRGMLGDNARKKVRDMTPDHIADMCISYCRKLMDER